MDTASFDHRDSRSAVPDHIFDPPLAPRGPRIPQLDVERLPQITVTHTPQEIAVAEAAAMRTTASGIEALADDSRFDAIIDQAVELSPLPNWIDRLVIRQVVKYLAPAIRSLANRIEAAVQ